MPAATLSKRGRMIWGLSLHGWEEVMRGSLAIVGVFGLLVGLATYFVVTLTREEAAESKRQFEEYRAEAAGEVSKANEHIAVLSTQGEQLRKDTAEANARAVEAQFALEKLKAPRLLSAEHQAKIVEVLKPFARQEYALSLSPVSEASFVFELTKALADSGWLRTKPFGIITIEGGEAAVNILSGVFVTHAPSRTDKQGVAAKVVEALALAGISATVEAKPMLEDRPNVIEIMIGNKPTN